MVVGHDGTPHMICLRRPVAITSDAGGQNPLVVCDDGSVWEYSGSGWDELAPIPGSMSSLNAEEETKP